MGQENNDKNEIIKITDKSNDDFLTRVDKIIQTIPPSSINSAKTLFAGGIAGVVSRTVVSPFERIKILFQTQVQKSQLDVNYQQKYTSVPQAFAKIWRDEGFKGYFKGNLANCARIFPATAIQFWSFEWWKKHIPIREGKTELTPWQRVLAGGLAGVTALIVTYPLELMRARLSVQTTEHKYKGIFHGMGVVVRTNGFFGLYKGLWPSIIGVFPYVGIDFACFDILKRNLPRRPNGTLDPITSFIVGAVSGTVAQTVAYPLDTIRRRVQVQEFFGTENLPVEQRYKGVLDAAWKITKYEGARGFFRGIWPNYLKVLPSIGLQFMVFEQLKGWMNITSHNK